jgi:CHAT domain-containing protein/TolA-binding protein
MAAGRLPPLSAPARLAFALALLFLAAATTGEPALAASPSPPSEPPAAAKTLTEQALDLAKARRFGEAEALFRRAIAIDEAALPPGDPEIGRLQFFIGQTLLDQGKPAEAEPYFRRSLAIAEAASGENNTRVATNLDRLGQIAMALGRRTEAVVHLKRALAIRERVLDVTSPQIDDTEVRLTVLLRTLGRDDEAKRLDRERARKKEGATFRRDALTAMAGVHAAEVARRQASARIGKADYAGAIRILEDAADQMEIVLGEGHPSVAALLHDLASSYRDVGRYADAEPLLQRVVAIFEGHREMSRDLAQALVGLASVNTDLGHLVAAEPLLRRALEAAERTDAGRREIVPQALNSLAMVLAHEGRVDEAVPLSERALSLVEASADANAQATVMANLALNYAGQQRYGEAEELLERARDLQLKRDAGNGLAIATVLDQLGEVYFKQGRYDAAVKPFEQACPLYEKQLGPQHPIFGNCLNNLAEALDQTGHKDAAEALLRRALAITEAALGTDHREISDLVLNLATIHEAQFRLDEAIVEIRRAADLARRVYATTAAASRGGATALRAARNTFLRHAYIALTLAERGGADVAALTNEAFIAAQQAQAGEVGRTIAHTAARFAAGRTTLGAMIRERQDAIVERNAVETRFLDAASQPEADRPAFAAELNKKMAEIVRRVADLDVAIARDFPGYAALANPKPLGMAAVRALLGADEALILFAATDRWQGLAWFLRADRMAVRRLDFGPGGARDLVERLRDNLDGERNPSMEEYPGAVAARLYQSLFPAIEEILAGARHLIVVTDGPLQRLPLSVLLTAPPPAGGSDLDRTPWLIRRFALTSLPSVASLSALRALPPAAAGRAPFLGVGNPLIGETRVAPREERLAAVSRGAPLQLEQIRLLPALPDTEDELRALGGLLGADPGDLVLRERATKPTLLHLPLERYRVLAFATHALVAGDFSLREPALVLTPPTAPTTDDDGLLTASDIAALKLDADWVVLSACNTAADDGASGAEGLSGLARAFFYAGSRALLVSHWPVISAASVRITTGTFEQLAREPTIGRAEALRRTMLGLADGNAGALFRHPMAWAPFVLVGEGGAAR